MYCQKNNSNSSLWGIKYQIYIVRKDKYMKNKISTTFYLIIGKVFLCGVLLWHALHAYSSKIKGLGRELVDKIKFFMRPTLNIKWYLTLDKKN